MAELQSLIDKYVQSESGAELSRNLQLKHGAVADMVHNPKTNVVAFQLLAPSDAMAYDRILAFKLKDFLHQKKKDQDRLALRGEHGVIYVLEPVRSDEARHDFAYYELDPEQKKAIRESLIEATNYS
jgi:hypothetical protein